MRAVGRYDPIRSRTKSHPHTDSTKTAWMDHGTGAMAAPNVWLVRMSPGSELGVHFHVQNQYQVFVEGSGRIGANKVAPITVHYAGAYSGYGPIVAGPDGLAYFTVRAGHDSGAQFLPGARRHMRPGPKRVMTSPVLKPLAQGGERIQGTRAVRTFFDGGEGPIAEAVQLEAKSSIEFVPSTGAGGFVYVLAGSVDAGGSVLRRDDWFFASHEEGPMPLTALDGAAEVLLLQMPGLQPAYTKPSAPSPES